MFVNLNSNGTVYKTVGDRVFRKSNNANVIALFAPFAKDVNVYINFKLPNNTTYSGTMTFKEFSEENQKNLWTYNVLNNITEYAGTVEVSFEIHTVKPDEVITTAKVNITVEECLDNNIVVSQPDEYLALFNQAKNTSDEAKVTADEAKSLWESYQGAGDTNLEVVQARDNFLNLKARLDNLKGKNWSSKAKPTCKVTFIDDDGQDTFYTGLRPIALAKNIKYTCAYPTHHTGMTDAQLDQLKLDGLFEIVSHTHNHIDLDAETEATIRTDLELSVNWLKARGYNYKCLVTPFGGINATSRRLVKEYFDYAFEAISGYNYQPIYQYEIFRQALGSNGEDTLQTYKDMVDKANSTGAWLVFMSHAYEATFNGTILSDLIDYIKSINIDIVSCAEGIELFGNLIDIGDNTYQYESHEHFIVSKNGRIKGTGDYTIQRDDSKTVNSPITDYPKDRVTVSYIYSGAAYPEAQAGVLETYRISNDSREQANTDVASHQIWKPYFANTIYMRKWDATNKVWKSWVRIIDPNAGATIVTATNKYTTTSAPATIEADNGANRVVITPIYSTSPDLANFPEGKQGFLTTYNIMVGGSYGYVYQEYKVIGLNNRYMRWWNAGTTAWMPWIRITPNLALSTTDRNNLAANLKNRGDMVFDITLGHPIWWNGANWVDSAGTVV